MKKAIFTFLAMLLLVILLQLFIRVIFPILVFVIILAICYWVFKDDPYVKKVIDTIMNLFKK